MLAGSLLSVLFGFHDQLLNTQLYLVEIVTGKDGKPADVIHHSSENLFHDIDESRVPLKFLANLLGAGHEGVVRYALAKQKAVRWHHRAENVGDIDRETADRMLREADWRPIMNLTWLNCGLAVVTLMVCLAIVALPTDRQRTPLQRIVGKCLNNSGFPAEVLNVDLNVLYSASPIGCPFRGPLCPTQKTGGLW
jgi:hypothetical protein